MNVSIKEKFLLYFILTYFVSAGILCYIIYSSAQNAIMERTFYQLTSVKNVKKKQIESFFADRIHEISNLNYLCNLPESENYRSNIAFLDRNLRDYILNNRYFNGYCLYDSTFRLLNSVSTINSDAIVIDPAFFNDFDIHNISNDLSDSVDCHIHDYSLNPITNNPEQFFSYKLTVSKINYYIIIRLIGSSIDRIMLENNPQEGLGHSGESYIVGDDNLMRSSSRFLSNSILNTGVNSESVERAFKNENSYIITKDYRSIEVLSSFEKLNIKGLNWALLAEIDYNEAFQPVVDMRRKIIIISTVISGFIFIIVALLNRLITKPIILLKNATKELSNGNLDKRLPVKSTDEIGELTESFNNMADKLKQKDIELQNEQIKRYTLVMDAQEIEKERLSRELHDGLGQMFIGLKLKLESIDLSGEIDLQNYIMEISELKTGLDDVINEIRFISNDLMPSVLKEIGIVPAISNLCNTLNNNSITNFTLETNLSNDIKNQKTKIYIYRIIQEAVSNIIKHSSASNAEIKLLENVNSNDNYSYKLIITDDGVGFNIDEAMKSSGNGLYNIKERVNALSGKINIESGTNGTLLIINIPNSN